MSDAATSDKGSTSQGTTTTGGSDKAAAGSVTSEQYAALEAKLQEATTKLTSYESKASEGERAKAHAAHEAELEKLRTQGALESQRALKLETGLKRAAAMNHLAGLKRPETFLPLVLDKVAVDEAGALTVDSKKALDTWRTENPELFATGSTGSAPMANGGGGAAESWDADALAMFRGARMNPAAESRVAAAGLGQFFGRGGGFKLNLPKAS